MTSAPLSAVARRWRRGERAPQGGCAPSRVGPRRLTETLTAARRAPRTGTMCQSRRSASRVQSRTVRRISARCETYAGLATRGRGPGGNAPFNEQNKATHQTCPIGGGAASAPEPPSMRQRCRQRCSPKLLAGTHENMVPNQRNRRPDRAAQHRILQDCRPKDHGESCLRKAIDLVPARHGDRDGEFVGGPDRGDGLRRLAGRSAGD